jgi:hypothetical protein
MTDGQTITVYRGEEAVVPFTGPTPAVDITGWPIVVSVAAAAGQTVLHTYTVAGGDVTITDGPAGAWSLTIPWEDTAALPAPAYRWDAWHGTTRVPLAGGHLVVREPVRRPA